MYLVELNHIRVPQDFKNADLAGHSFDVCLLDDLLFLEGFNCHFLCCGDVHAKSHFAEGALADRLAWNRPLSTDLVLP